MVWLLSALAAGLVVYSGHLRRRARRGRLFLQLQSAITLLGMEMGEGELVDANGHEVSVRVDARTLSIPTLELLEAAGESEVERRRQRLNLLVAKAEARARSA